MSKFYNIRWREDDQDALRKAVKNFNAKITRLEKKDPTQKSALPERVTVKQMRELIDTRQDLNRELNALRRFTRPGAEQLVEIPEHEYNMKITKWQKEEMTRRVAIINRKRKDRYDAIKDLEMESRGEALGYTVGQAEESIGSVGMGSVDKNAARPMNPFSEKMTRPDLKAKFRNIMKESQSTYWNAREMIMKETYKKTLLQNFSEADVKEVLSAIDDMSFKDFYSKFKKDSGKFESLYPTDNAAYQSYVEGLKSTWVPELPDEEF